MKREDGLTLVLAALLGASLWALSPWILGHPEPWDAAGHGYFLALLASGVLAGMVKPRPLWGHYVGVVVGQILYEVIFLPIGPMFLLGVGFLLALSPVFTAGAVLGRYLRTYLVRPPPGR